MKTSTQIQEAIETWRSLALKPDLTEREAEVMERCEKAILRTAVWDRGHAGAICDVVLYNMGSGGRTDQSEVKAIESLRLWVAQTPAAASRPMSSLQ